MSKTLIIFGAVLLVVGLLGQFTRLGRLPGDIAVERSGFGFYFPITTMIIVSIVLTLLLNLFMRR